MDIFEHIRSGEVRMMQCKSRCVSATLPICLLSESEMPDFLSIILIFVANFEKQTDSSNLRN